MVRQVASASEFRSCLQGAGNKLVVVDFFATWCPPCQRIAPIFEAMSNKYAAQAVFLKVNTEEVKDLAMEHQVRSIPTFIFFHKGTKLEVIQGADQRKLEDTIARLVAQHVRSSFPGKGFSLKDSSSSSSSSSSSPQSSASAQEGQPRRRNPWADPNWVPPSMRPQPQQPEKAQQQDRQPETQAASAPNSSDVQVDPHLLMLLQEMGFSRRRGEQALLNSGNADIEQALNWLSEHEEKEEAPKPEEAEQQAPQEAAADAPQDVPAPAASPPEQQQQQDVVEKESNAVEGGSSTLADDMVEMDEEMRAIVESAAVASKKSKVEPAAAGSVDEHEAPQPKAVKDMTFEEKMRWLEERKAAARAKREAEQLEKIKSSEKNRRELGRAAVDLQRQKEDTEAQRVVDERKKAARDKKKHQSELRAKLAAEKARRQEEAENRRKELDALRSAKQ